MFSIPALSIYLTSYEISKKYLGTKFLPQDSKPSLLQQIPIFVSSGMIAEATSGGLWTILDVLKGRQQKANRSIPGNEASMSASKLLAKIWREEGAAGVWRGYFVSMVVFVWVLLYSYHSYYGLSDLTRTLFFFCQFFFPDSDLTFHCTGVYMNHLKLHSYKITMLIGLSLLQFHQRLQMDSLFL